MKTRSGGYSYSHSETNASNSIPTKGICPIDILNLYFMSAVAIYCPNNTEYSEMKTSRNTQLTTTVKRNDEMTDQRGTRPTDILNTSPVRGRKQSNATGGTCDGTDPQTRSDQHDGITGNRGTMTTVGSTCSDTPTHYSARCLGKIFRMTPEAITFLTHQNTHN